MTASTIDEAIYQHLAAQAGLTALIESRIYPDRLPEGVGFPAVMFQQVSVTATYSHGGDSNLDRARFQFDCWGESRAATAAVESAVRLALSGLHTTVGSVEIQAAFLVGGISSYDDGLKRWRRTSDFMFWYRV